MHPDPTERDIRLPISITVAPEAVELAADRLFVAGASAVSETDDPDGRVTLVADPSPEHLDDLAVEFADADFRLLEQGREWNDTWRDHATTVSVGERLVLRPAWLPEVPDLPDGSVELLIDAGQTFGSGSHETTRCCLAALEQRVQAGDRVLDVGCGSGILGIAAALLGAATVTGIDIDAEAVLVTNQLAELNGVSDRVQASGTALSDVSGRFELVLANLLIPIIEEHGAELVERVAPGGTLVISGVLTEQRQRALDACAGLTLAQELAEGAWCALVMVAERADRA